MTTTQLPQSSQPRSKPKMILFDFLEAEAAAEDIIRTPNSRNVNRWASIIARNCTDDDCEEIRELAEEILLTGNTSTRAELAEEISVRLKAL